MRIGDIIRETAMPQYQLDTSGEVAATDWRDLDEFTQAFIEAAFWTSECPGVDSEEFETEEHQEAMREGCADGTIPGDVGFDDLTPEALASITALCRAFQAEAGDLLAEAYGRADYSPAQAGHDYWLTYNGHGTGFWDRKPLENSELWEELGSPRVGEPGWDEYAKAKDSSLGERLSKACGRGELYLYFQAGKVGLEGY
jgi:hypothetical protein